MRYQKKYLGVKRVEDTMFFVYRLKDSYSFSVFIQKGNGEDRLCEISGHLVYLIVESKIVIGIDYDLGVFREGGIAGYTFACDRFRWPGQQ